MDVEIKDELDNEPRPTVLVTQNDKNGNELNPLDHAIGIGEYVVTSNETTSTLSTPSGAIGVDSVEPAIQSNPFQPEDQSASIPTSPVVLENVLVQPIVSASAILTTANDQPGQLLLLVNPTTGESNLILPSTLTSECSTFLPPPPLKRFPTAAIDQSTAPCPPSLSASISNQHLIASSTGHVPMVSVELNGPKKKKRRKKPSKVPQPTPEELERVAKFKMLFRMGQTGTESSGDGQQTSTSISSESNLANVLPPPPFLRVGANQTTASASASASITMEQQKFCLATPVTTVDHAYDEQSLVKMTEATSVPNSNGMPRHRIKQSDLNCRHLLKEFGELKARIHELEGQLGLEKLKNQSLQHLLTVRSRQNVIQHDKETQTDETGNFILLVPANS